MHGGSAWTTDPQNTDIALARLPDSWPRFDDGQSDGRNGGQPHGWIPARCPLEASQIQLVQGTAGRQSKAQKQILDSLKFLMRAIPARK